MKCDLYKLIETRILGLLCICLLATSCAPGLGSSLSVKAAGAAHSDETATFFSIPVRIHIGDFTDSRKEVFIGEISGRALLPDGNVPLQVKKVLANTLKPRGVSLTSNADVRISGAIKDWMVDVQPGFPMSLAAAKSTIELEVTNPEGETYRASYSGEAAINHPFLRESTVEKVLGWALQSAVDSAMEDGQFLAAIGVL